MIDTVIVNSGGTDTEVRVVDIASFADFATNVFDVILVNGRRGRVTDAAFINKWDRSNA